MQRGSHGKSRLRIRIASLVLALGASGGSIAEEWSVQVLQPDPGIDGRTASVVSAVALHPEGRLVAIGGDDHRIRVCDLADGSTKLQLDAHADWVRALAYSPTGRTLASGGHDGRIVLWDAETGEQQRELAALPRTISGIVFSHGGHELFSIGFGDKLRMFDVQSRSQVYALDGPCLDMRALSYSPERRLIASAGRNGIIRVWDAQEGIVLQEHTAHSRRIWALAFSPDGQYLASCGEDRNIRVFRLDGQVEFMLQCPGTKMMALAFCGPDQLATGGTDNRIHIWDLNRRTEVAELEGHTGSVVTLAYSGNALVSAGFDTTVRVWKRSNNLAEDPSSPQRRVGARDTGPEFP